MNLFEVLAILMLIVGFVIGAVTAFEDSNFNHGARYMMRWERVTTVSDKASCVNFLGDRTIFWGDGMVFYENPPCAKLRIITSRDSLWCSSGFAT